MEEIVPNVNEYIKELTDKIVRLETRIGSVRSGARFDPNIDPNKLIKQINESTHKWVYCRDGMWRALKRTDEASKRQAIEKMVSTKATKKAALQEILDAPVETVPVEMPKEEAVKPEPTTPVEDKPSVEPEKSPVEEDTVSPSEVEADPQETETVEETASETDGEELDEAIRKHVSQTKKGVTHSIFGSNYREEDE